MHKIEQAFRAGYSDEMSKIASRTKPYEETIRRQRAKGMLLAAGLNKVKTTPAVVQQLNEKKV